jgi:holo-[acyl-carrier protein] synthase
MIYGVGTDLCSVVRMTEALARTPNLKERLFHPNELSLSGASLAARFAAKEALAKAIGNPKLLNWSEIEIVKDELGKPSIALHGESKSRVANLGITAIQLSLSHEQELASAFVVLEAT